jgi:hypothetical protein
MIPQCLMSLAAFPWFYTFFGGTKPPTSGPTNHLRLALQVWNSWDVAWIIQISVLRRRGLRRYLDVAVQRPDGFVMVSESWIWARGLGVSRKWKTPGHQNSMNRNESESLEQSFWECRSPCKKSLRSQFARPSERPLNRYIVGLGPQLPSNSAKSKSIGFGNYWIISIDVKYSISR